MSDVEFTIIVQKWPIYVHLDNVGMLLTLFGLSSVNVNFISFVVVGGFIVGSLLNNSIKLIDLIDNRNPPSLIGILPRLNNPNIPGLLLILISILFFL